jgi:gamma-glutamyltranspeptidase/glutathione hydrolase
MMSELPIAGSYRPTIMGTRGMVSSGHYLASLAGERLLARGGNAIDAGVAAGLCLCVLQTDMVNLAGVAPIMVYLATENRVVTISGLGRWPQAASVAYFHEHCGGRIPTGVWRCITPGAPDAWLTALAEYGSMSLAEVMQEAISLAEDGFPMHPFMAANLREAAAQLAQWDSSAAIFLPGGRPPEPGEIFAQRDLARTMRRLLEAEAGAAQQGRRAALQAARDAFYCGDIAHEIAAFYQAQGGLLTYDDLAAFRVQTEEPVRASFREYDIYTCGPWCQGPVLAQVLTLLEGYDLQALGHNSPAYVHLLTEALKLAFADRERYYGDPEFVEVPMQALLSPQYAAARRQLLHLDHAHAGMPPAGDPWQGNGAATPWGRDSLVPGATTAETLDTTYVCAVDEHGNVFSATPSDTCMNAPVTPGTGLVVSTRGSQSWAVEGHASAIAPGKRPRLTPCPAIVFKNGKPFMPLGTPGGDVQCQAMLQVFLNLAVFGMTPQAAIEAPRFATYSYPGSFEPHDYLPGELRIERRLATQVGDNLATKGHRVVPWPDWTWRAGGVCTITIDHHSGVLAAGADPRRMSYAIGW